MLLHSHGPDRKLIQVISKYITQYLNYHLSICHFKGSSGSCYLCYLEQRHSHFLSAPGICPSILVLAVSTNYFSSNIICHVFFVKISQSRHIYRKQVHKLHSNRVTIIFQPFSHTIWKMPPPLFYCCFPGPRNPGELSGTDQTHESLPQAS